MLAGLDVDALLAGTVNTEEVLAAVAAQAEPAAAASTAQEHQQPPEAGPQPGAEPKAAVRPAPGLMDFGLDLNPAGADVDYFSSDTDEDMSDEEL